MGSSEKKRAREQSAAARRDRVAKKRAEKSAAPSEAAGSPFTFRLAAPTQTGDEATAPDRDMVARVGASAPLAEL